MKHRYIICAMLIAVSLSSFAQNGKINLLIYQSYRQGVEKQDTSYTIVQNYNNQIAIADKPTNIDKSIPGLPKAVTYVDYDSMTAFSQLIYPENESYYAKSKIGSKHIKYTAEGTETILGFECTKYTTSINSNRIEIWMTTALGYSATPMAQFADLEGVMVKFVRNGSSTTEIIPTSITSQKVKNPKIYKHLIPDNLGVEMIPRELDNIRRNKMIITTNVFDNDRIHWGDTSRWTNAMPMDTVIHFAGGTLILKRLTMPQLPSHYQVYAEVYAHSEGDAYDRTGSIFVIPTWRELSLYDALAKDISQVPGFYSKTGEEYRGMKIEDNYLPVIELIRFFTPFGVRHFNDRVQIDGLEWDDEVYYKQDITDLAAALAGDVIIGAFIGNYDGGGHKLSMDIKAYPGAYEWNTEEETTTQWILPIFNTCNVMEMAGQNYPRFFDTDSLTVTFEIPEGIENIELRYITTGHGGWGGGDEFNPKANTIIIDGRKEFVYTPWRSDCGTFRELNPVSGNFWNGVSSSDYSRSGWCPGTATQPTYFDLSHLAPGKHTLTIAIPQGKAEGGSFSAWSVSGVLIGTKRK